MINQKNKNEVHEILKRSQALEFDTLMKKIKKQFIPFELLDLFSKIYNYDMDRDKHVMFALIDIYQYGRMQGIREERARRRRELKIR